MKTLNQLQDFNSLKNNIEETNDKGKMFNTVYDLYKHCGLPYQDANIHVDFDAHCLQDVHLTFPFSSPLFRQNYFSFVFVKDGSGKYRTNENFFEIVPQMIYFTNPGHLKSFHWEHIQDVCLVTFDESFLKKYVSPKIFEEFPFLLSETVPPRVLTKIVFKEFELLYRQVMKEYSSEGIYRKRIIGNLFVVILLKIKEHFWQDYDPIYEGDRSSEIIKNFKLSLEQHYRDLSNDMSLEVYRIKDYADQLNLNPNYLSNVIKIKTGKPISIWIADKTFSEAQLLLHNPEISIKEIAYRLGFAEPSHFSNFFKKHAGIYPTAYRKKKR